MEIPKLSLMDPNFTLPPRILVHALSGMGKTHLGLQFPNPLFFMCELGITDNKDGQIKYSAFRIDSLADMHLKIDELESFLASLVVNNYKSPYKTLVLDNITELELFAKNQVAKDNKVSSFTDLAFGMGYEKVKELLTSEVNVCPVGQRLYKGILPRLYDLGYKYGLAILILSQTTYEEVVGSDTVSRKIYKPDLTKSTRNEIVRKMDEVIYIHNKVVELPTAMKNKPKYESCGYTFMSGNGQPYYDTKSRCGLPSELPYIKNEGFNELSQYLPKWYEE